MNPKSNIILFWIMALFCFLAIGIKVFGIPITHDETATTIHYSHFGWWEIMMYPDNWPNNHILNTLLVKSLLLISEPSQWLVRLPNWLSFIIYAWGVFRILDAVFGKKHLFFPAGLSFFLINPYLLDFFGLSRGYGMATAFSTLAVSYLFTAFQREKPSHIAMAVGCATLGSYASFTNLVLWVAIGLFSAGALTRTPNTSLRERIGGLVGLVAAAVGFLALINTPLTKMASTGQFQYWSSSGFYRETMISLADQWKYGGLGFLTADLLAVVWIGMTLTGLYLTFRSLRAPANFWVSLRQPVPFSTLLILLTVIVNQVQAWTLGTPNLSGRTALFFYPLLAFLASSLLAAIPTHEHRLFWRFGAVLLPAFLILHGWAAYRSESTREWWFDAHTVNVLNYLQEHRHQDTIRLQTNWHFHPSFHFYVQTGKAPGIDLHPYQKEIHPENGIDFAFVMPEDTAVFLRDFHLVRSYTPVGYLLERTSPDNTHQRPRRN